MKRGYIGITALSVFLLSTVFIRGFADEALILVDYEDVIGNGPSFYGVEYSWIDQDKDLYLERFRRLHGNVVRAQISQELFEPDYNSGGAVDFSRTFTVDSQTGKTLTYETMFKSLASQFPEMHFQINIWLCAKWNASEPAGYLGLGGAFPPRDYARHKAFVRQLASWLVKTCGILPEHLSVTFINEVNLAGFFIGNHDDLLKMAKETRNSLNEVSPLIQMGGLEEVNSTSWIDAFYLRAPKNLCALWTFHVYKEGIFALGEGLLRGIKQLKRYGPVWVTEFADTTYGSPDAKMDFSTREAALEFAELLARLWRSGIDGIIHFRLSDTYTDRFEGGWVGHGLFADAKGTHSNGRPYEPFASYWVFANMYRELGGGELLRTTAPEKLTVVSARKNNKNEKRLAIWVSNITAERRDAVLKIDNFPAVAAKLMIFNTLQSDEPLAIKMLQTGVKSVKVVIPGSSSYLFVISAVLENGS